MTLEELSERSNIFYSNVWTDFVSEIRAYIDGTDTEDPYRINTINEYIKEEYGALEVLPKYYTINNNDYVVNETYVRQTVDALIGANKPYWERLLQSLLAEFDPLYNVDATETTTTVYGEHETTDAKGARTHTDTLGPTEETTEYGQQSATSGARSDSSTDGAQEITHKETTMDDTASFRNKTQDSHAAVSNSYSKGQQIDTVQQHTDTVSTTQVQNTATDTAVNDKITSGEHTDTETVRRYGNIGVTMSTQLLRDFQKFAKESDLVHIIADTLSRALTFSIWY